MLREAPVSNLATQPQTHATTPTPDTTPDLSESSSEGPGQVASAPATSLPPLTPELRHILTRFFTLNQDPLALASDLSKDIIETITILADASLLAWITHFQNLMAARRRELALQTLEQLCKTSEDPIEQRRTATRLLSATRRAIENRAIEVDSPHHHGRWPGLAQNPWHGHVVMSVPSVQA